MGKQFLGTSAGQTGKNFNSNRTISGLPLPMRSIIRTWCKLNGVFMDQDGTYITWCEQEHGKEKIHKLFLNYHKTMNGKEFVIAKNHRTNKMINVTSMMAVENQIQLLAEENENMQVFNSLLTQKID